MNEEQKKEIFKRLRVEDLPEKTLIKATMIFLLDIVKGQEEDIEKLKRKQTLQRIEIAELKRKTNIKEN